MKFHHIALVTKEFVKGHKSEIATGAGVILELAAVGLTARATVKAKADADALKKRLDILWAEVEALEEGPEREQQQKEMEKTEKKEIRKCVRHVARYYIWPGICTVGSIALFIFSVKNGRREIRNLSAALTAQLAAEKMRKERAKKMLTEDQFNELYYGIKKSGKTYEDKDGNEHELYEYCVPADNNFDAAVGPQKIAVSKHALIFDKNCREWTRNWDYCMSWIRKVEDWANQKVLSDGYVRLNDIREYLGDRTSDNWDESEDLGIVFHPEFAQAQVQFEVFEMMAPDQAWDDPRYVIDVNYENIRGKINGAIRALNE